MDDLPGTLNSLTARLEALERRVAVLEHPAEAAAPPAIAPAELSVAAEPTALPQPMDIPSAPQAISVFTILGRALLGIAGAYVLRAVAESNTLAMPLVAALAIAYAFAWLAVAARQEKGGWLAPGAYAATSAFILVPLLWELTLRFRLFPPLLTAAVITGFAAAPALLAWRRNFAALAWVTNTAAAALALALLVATYEVVPFAAVLLAMAALSEFTTLRGHETGVRALVAFAADLALSIVIYVYASPAAARPDYPEIAPAALLALLSVLFLIFAVGVLVRTVGRKDPASTFAVVQTTIAFLLAASAFLSFGSPASIVALGSLCIALAAAGYAAALVLFGAQPDPRNQSVFAAWSALLLLAGSLLALPAGFAALLLGLSALAALLVSRRLRKPALELHGLLWLLAAATVSGLLQYIAQTLAATLPGAPGWAMAAPALCAIACLIVLPAEEHLEWRRAAVRFSYALLATATITAAAARLMIYLLTFALPPAAHHLAFLRMAALCAVSAAFAFYGARTCRAELTRIGYTLLALAALKLLLEDVRHGNLAFIAAAIFLFALTLIAVPRIARLHSRTWHLHHP
jgi:hypothetical protein